MFFSWANDFVGEKEEGILGSYTSLQLKVQRSTAATSTSKQALDFWPPLSVVVTFFLGNDFISI